MVSWQGEFSCFNMVLTYTFMISTQFAVQILFVNTITINNIFVFLHSSVIKPDKIWPVAGGWWEAWDLRVELSPGS